MLHMCARDLSADCSRAGSFYSLTGHYRGRRSTQFSYPDQRHVSDPKAASSDDTLPHSRRKRHVTVDAWQRHNDGAGAQWPKSDNYQYYNSSNGFNQYPHYRPATNIAKHVHAARADERSRNDAPEHAHTHAGVSTTYTCGGKNHVDME